MLVNCGGGFDLHGTVMVENMDWMFIFHCLRILFEMAKRGHSASFRLFLFKYDRFTESIKAGGGKGCS